MSSGNSKLSSKLNRRGDVRTLKKILPKINPVETRVIEINAPAMQMCKCFVCDQRVISSGVPLLQSTTQASNTDLPTKIGQLMGEKFMVVVSAEDVLCRKCHALVNHVDKLESDLLLVKRSLRDHLKKKYGLNDDIKETDFITNDSEVETEYALIQDVESEEDHEPRAKKKKQTKPLRFRAIKPKPPGSVLLLKCPSCNFITTELHLLSSHSHVCKATAYKCTMCDKKFDSQKMIRSHKIEAHLTKWICHFCNITFEEEEKFTVHMKNHLGDRLNKPKVEEVKKEKPVLSFKCPRCPEYFEAFSQLQIHLVNHRSSVTFKCVRCDVGFLTKQELIDHVKSHEETEAEEYILPGSPKEIGSPETLFSCPMCSLSFLQEEFYLEHISMHQDLESNQEQQQQQQQQEQQEESELNLFEEENGKKEEEEEELECPNCGEKKEDAGILEMHRLTECTGAKAVNEVKEVGEENPGEEASHLELNQLLHVNSVNVELANGNVFLQNEKSEIDGNANSKSVEDIIEKMFQVKDEAKRKGEGQEGIEVKQDKTFVCADCSFTTQDLAVLNEHFAEIHGALKCWMCKKNFSTEELRKHLATEHGATPVALPQKAYSCIHCSIKFSNKRALHLHEITHPENLKIECPDCEEKFAREKFLNEHREAVHQMSHCRVCQKGFENVKQLKSHEARHAKSEKSRFKCLECNKMFQTSTGLRHHQAVHTGEFKFNCEFCKKGFISRVHYEEHRASHTKEERYSCEICGRKFTFQATYWIHRKWHDNPTPYKCVYCGKLFKHSSLLSIHRRKHTGERPYACPHCDQSFTVGNTLKRHLMIHTGKFPFTCKICNQGFSGRHKMAVHLSRAHQDNSLLVKKPPKKPSEYKVAVKPDSEEEQETNQTWILAENNSQLLTIQTEEGENIPCTLLTDDMIENIVNTNNGIVEIIPYDSATQEEPKDNEVGFILMNQPEKSSMGIISDGEDFGEASQVYNRECENQEGMEGTSETVQIAPCSDDLVANSENMVEEFVSGL